MAKILVAEDDPGTRELLSLALTREGHEVSTAEDGEAAMEAIADSAPDILLTDIMMPGCDGIELARWARDVRPGMGVMFVSGFPSLLSQAGDDLGLNAVLLTKPVDMSELLARVNAMSSNEQGAN